MLLIIALVLAFLYAIMKPLSDGLFDTSAWVAKMLMPAENFEGDTKKQALMVEQGALMKDG